MRTQRSVLPRGKAWENFDASAAIPFSIELARREGHRILQGSSSKVLGTQNPSELCAKLLSQLEMETYIDMTHHTLMKGQYALCPRI